MESNKYAPVILFVYNRLDHTKKTIEALQNNIDAKKSELFIFSDAPKNIETKTQVENVRKYIKTVKGFKNVSIIEREKNMGLAASIIDGVTKICNQYSKVIVLEDDLITSKNFLCYMNEALNYYEDKKYIFSIAGYSPSLKSLRTYKKDTYLSYRPSSWGWGTWIDRWMTVDWDIEDFDTFIKNNKQIKMFNRGGNDLTRMLKHYKERKNNSWAIRWAYAMYKEKKYAIYPKISKIQNIGFGEYATHCKGIDIYHTVLDHSSVCKFDFTNEHEPNEQIAKEFKYQYSYTNKLIKKVFNIFQGFKR